MAILKTLGQWFLGFVFGWVLDFYNKSKNKKAAEAKAKALRDNEILNQMENYKDATTQDAKEKAFTDLVRCVDCK